MFHIVEARYNASSIGKALSEFESEYGKFPDSSTVAEVRLFAGTSKLTFADTTSNDLFAQLLACGIVDREYRFYAKAKSARMPDDKFDTDSSMLEHGECAFAYICGLSSTSAPSRPIAFGPVIPGTATLDRESCEGHAVVLRTDGTTEELPINPAGQIIVNGLDLLDPRQPFWHGRAPDVKWPK